MPVGATQVFDGTLAGFLSDAGTQWDASGTGLFYAILVSDAAAPVDTDSTLADIGAGGTEAQVGADTAAYIAPGGDGAPIEVPTRTLATTLGATEFRFGNLDFGSSVTITGVKYVVILQGNVASIQSTDPVRFWLDLDTGGGEVSATAGAFVVSAPTNNNWFQINAQQS